MLRFVLVGPERVVGNPEVVAKPKRPGGSGSSVRNQTLVRITLGQEIPRSAPSNGGGARSLAWPIIDREGLRAESILPAGVDRGKLR